MKNRSKRSLALLIILVTLVWHGAFVYFFTNVRFDLSKSPAAFKQFVKEILSKTKPYQQQELHDFVSHAPNNAPVIYRSDDPSTPVDTSHKQETQKDDLKEKREQEIDEKLVEKTDEREINEDNTLSTEVSPNQNDFKDIAKENQKEEAPEESIIQETQKEATSIVQKQKKTNPSDQQKKPSITLDQLALQQVLKRDLELRKRYFLGKSKKDADQTESTNPQQQPLPQNTKPNLSMAQIAHGFMHHMGSITTVGNKNGKATAQQIAFERYTEKVAQCLETSFKISNNKHVCQMKQNNMEIILEIDAQGKLSMLLISQSSTNPIVDQFALDVFKNASSSFPAPPQSIGNMFRIAFMLNHISNLAHMGHGVLTTGSR